MLLQDALGISLTASAAILPAVVVGMIVTIIGIIDLVSSAYAVADAARGIYSIATGAGNKYNKAEDYAHDVTLLVVSVVSVRDAASAVKQNLKLFKSAAQDLAGWTARPKTSDLANASKSAGLISSMDDFTDYAKGFLDEDALQYVREALGNDADDSAQLKKIAQLAEDGSKKVGKKLSKEEVKAGLDALWDDAGAEGALAAIERVCNGGLKQAINNKFPNDNQIGKTFDYTIENGKIKTQNGIQEVDFIVDMDGNLRLGSGHSYLADGNPVQAAGKMKINSQGCIRFINNLSGHYQPTVDQALNYPDILKKAGLNLDNSWIRINIFDASPSNYVINSETYYHGPIKYMPK